MTNLEKLFKTSSKKTMPVQKPIKMGETAEIRFQLHREGYYEETKYFIRYFQADGRRNILLGASTELCHRLSAR